jgi:hypothetical protein
LRIPFAASVYIIPYSKGAFVGSFLGAYVKRKGENLATHEDLDKLVKQVHAVTTTKAIRKELETATQVSQRLKKPPLDLWARN